MSEESGYQLPALTHERAVELLKEAVEERGFGFVYERPKIDYDGNEGLYPGNTKYFCHYVHSPVQQQNIARRFMGYPDGIPEQRKPQDHDVCGCIVGLVLHKHGVPMEEMVTITDARGLLEHLDRLGTMELPSVRTQMLLETVQDAQDEGWAWGMAVEKATAKWGEKPA